MEKMTKVPSRNNISFGGSRWPSEPFTEIEGKIGLFGRFAPQVGLYRLAIWRRWDGEGRPLAAGLKSLTSSQRVQN